MLLSRDFELIHIDCRLLTPARFFYQLYIMAAVDIAIRADDYPRFLDLYCLKKIEVLFPNAYQIVTRRDLLKQIITVIF
jgi:hypothetical protein